MSRISCSSRTQAAFTLIELLVVISILALLMGFIIPVFFGTKDKGNMARAKVEAKQLETAWKQFFLTYNRWPASVGSAAVSMDGGIVEELGGFSGSVNKKKIPFFDVPVSSNAQYQINDPWKTPYKVLFDHDFNTKISLPSEAGGGEVLRSVAVYTVFIENPEKENAKTNLITSWD